ncbi:AraC family transcriptional regulator [Mycolicibacterium phlei]|uniref:AraC family transcriptional regulator n=1 Tax=Mycolicibacterium phlei DSM 43239 = CCUG 21000 TaxID=1226750 RepID=A0A5N5UZA1_MYCPH|nr:AraC family transcriptional regulator [Mycolicibacterium phlei]KAB7753550.1 AraC family transcriptional regulator [Mycolicibacterium phlei DSM 43239 = CCUG 21000]KXW62453.1 AraC family transcriptional regulator [Mycolicibacterium phlei DSM 43239 = CCUG 21000]KXW69861.1 AraC family transcriptional regulator [Mycolicibacterium phlei DSM 43072]KXW70417.1 AraC family transcriptional regulator [Mycolicibacterium phlei DSM 43070]KXW76019.1 AraC family transcriptional regulator [Mycolicibacterium 
MIRLVGHVHVPRRSYVEIADPASAEEFLQHAYGTRLRLSRGHALGAPGRFLVHARTSVGPFAIEDIRVAGEVRVTSDPLNRVALVLPRGGRLRSECGRDAAEAAPGEVAVVAQPDAPYLATTLDLHTTSVLLESRVLAEVATGLPAANAQIHFGALAVPDPAATRMLRDTVAYVRDVILPDDVMATPLVLGQAARLLAAVTLSTFPNSFTAKSAPCDRTDHQPVLLRRAIEFMDSNVANDIALADIADAVHVTPRAVQYMFRRHLQTTPLQYLRRLRLHYAHQELQAADRANTTVTAIAARWGFAHTGRFAVMYREVYGCSPQDTLRG